MNRWLLAFALTPVLLACVPSTSASVDGPCQIFVQDEDLSTSDHPTVQPDSEANLNYTIVAPSPVRRWTVTLHYGPVEREILDRPFPAGSNEESGTMSVAAYTQYGSGVYEVTGRAELADGTTCFAVMHVEVGGSIFSSVLGVAAVAVLGVAGLGLLLTILQIILDAKDVVEAAKDFIAEARHTELPTSGPGKR